MKKSIFLTAIAAVLALASCGDDDDYSYSAGEPSVGAYLSAAKSSFVFTPDEAKVLKLTVGRSVSTDAETVTLEGNNPVFSVPASVAFAAGEKQKEVDIPFVLNTGESAKLTVKITSATSQYGSGSVTVNVVCDYNWESLGEGTFSDAFIGISEAKVEILQNPSNPNMYRIVGPYNEMKKADDYDPSFPPSDNMDIVIIQNGDQYNGITVNYDDLVGYDKVHTGYIDADVASERVVTHPAIYTKYADPATWYNNCVLAYQETKSNGVTLPGKVQLAPVYNLPQYATGAYGYHLIDEKNIVIISFPGYVESDYALSFKYSGNFADQFGKGEYALGSVTLGADVASARLAVATDANYDDVVAALIAGTTGEVVEASGEVKVPVAGGSDHYYMVIVAFDEDGNAVAAEDFRFFFTSCKEQWTVVGTGVYTYGAESLNVYDVDGMSFYEGTANATLYKSTTTDGLYTIKPWANAEANYGLTFWWDTASNEVIVDGADTGDEDIWEEEGETYNEGAVTFYELALVGVEAGYASFYDPASKTFNFYCTYLNAESNWYGAVKETFVLDAAATSRSFSLTPFAKTKHHGKAHRINFMMKRALSAKKNIKITM